MEFSLRCRWWSVLQVVAIIMACYRGKVSSERAQSCVGVRLSLRCPEMMVIEITDVVIGDSVCLGIDCCITDTDCTTNANPSHTADVHSRCDGQNSCIVDVVREEFGCGYFGYTSQNDFERITYNCRNDSRRYIAARSSSVHVQLTTVTFTSTLDISEAEELTLPPHAAPGHAYSSATYRIVIILCVVCLIVIIAVVVSVSIVTVRRKKRRQVKSSDAIKKSDVETDRKEAIYMNDAVRNSILMEFSLRCRYSSVLQVVAIIVCYRGKVFGERAEGCIGSRLSLRCAEMKVIEVTDVVLGDSDCEDNSCCIKDQDCTGTASATHVMDVYHRCNGHINCTVDVIKELFACVSEYNSSNDFERIAYNCIDDKRTTVSTEEGFGGYITTQSTSVQLTDVTLSQSSAPDGSGGDVPRIVNTRVPTSGPVIPEIIIVLCVVCLIVIIAVVVPVSIVTVRRKKRRQVLSSYAIKMSDIETDGKEAIYMNVNGQPVGTGLNENTRSSLPIYINGGARNLETQTSDYCEIEGVISEGIQCDSQYEKLVRGKKDEPLTVYQQLL